VEGEGVHIVQPITGKKYRESGVVGKVPQGTPNDLPAEKKREKGAESVCTTGIHKKGVPKRWGGTDLNKGPKPSCGEEKRGKRRLGLF